MAISVSVHINVTQEQAWAAFKDGLIWEDWYGTSVSFFMDKSGRTNGIQFHKHDGIAATECPVSGYVEGERLTVDGKLGSDTWSFSPDGDGCLFSRETRFAPGVGFRGNGEEEQRKKWQAEMEKFAEAAERTVRTPQLPEGATEVPDNFFRHCKSMTEFIVPDGVTRIGEFAFYNCRQLRSVRLPENVKEIAYCAFGACFTLEAINLPESLEAIGRYAFSSCTELKSLDLPSGLRTVGEGAFKRTGLKNVVLPESLKEAPVYMFLECDSLESVQLPKQMEKIQDGMFAMCGLKSFTVPETVKVLGLASFIKCEKLESIDFGPGLREIGKGTFSACKALKSLVIPPNVKVIGEQAFFGCDGVTDLTLPEGVEIGAQAFDYCKHIKNVRCPDVLADLFPGTPVYYRKKGLCQHCGGELKGLFGKKCGKCGKKKDY